MSIVIWGQTQELQCGCPCRVFCPDSPTNSLPLLYLLHGQFDQEEDWWGTKGQLPGILVGAESSPMCLVMPFCGHTKRPDQKDQGDPGLEQFIARIATINAAVQREYASRIDPERRGVLGISMGGRQALALALSKYGKSFSSLGVLSAKLQDPFNTELERFASRFDANALSHLRVYFHYCGKGGTDERYYSGNKGVCESLGGTLLEEAGGDHSWYYWRPRIAEFLRLWLKENDAGRHRLQGR